MFQITQPMQSRKCLLMISIKMINEFVNCLQVSINKSHHSMTCCYWLTDCYFSFHLVWALFRLHVIIEVTFFSYDHVIQLLYIFCPRDCRSPLMIQFRWCIYLIFRLSPYYRESQYVKSFHYSYLLGEGGWNEMTLSQHNGHVIAHELACTLHLGVVNVRTKECDDKSTRSQRIASNSIDRSTFFFDFV